MLGNREADSGAVATTAVGDGKRPKGNEVAASRIDGACPLYYELAWALSSVVAANMNWDMIAWVKKTAPTVKVLLKGVGRAEDVLEAYEKGADGVILSNHSGRQLEYAQPPMCTLVRTRQQYPQLFADKNFEIYVDGGVTRGTECVFRGYILLMRRG